MTSIVAGLARLAAATRSGAVGALCAQHEIDLAVLFGSAVPLFDALDDAGADALDDASVADHALPRDIDLALRPRRDGAPFDQLAVLHDLYELTGSERIDLMRLDRAGPVARHRALGRGRPLFAATPHLFAEAQIAAAMTYFDTQPLRDLDLALMASP